MRFEILIAVNIKVAVLLYNVTIISEALVGKSSIFLQNICNLLAVTSQQSGLNCNMHYYLQLDLTQN